MKNKWKKIFSKRKMCGSSVSNIETREEQENELPIIVLRIKLESFSEYYQIGKNYKWREKISNTAFDKSLADCANGNLVIKSYIDHKDNIEGIITSTNRDGVKLYKQDNEIVMEFPVEDDNPLAQKVYKSIKAGEITANSFIMRVLKYSTNETVENEMTTEEVVIEEAELISIDPVDGAFYKQNIMEARNLEGSQPDDSKNVAKEDQLKTQRQIKENKIMKDFIITYLLKRGKKQEEVDSLEDEALFNMYEEEKRAEVSTLINELRDEVAQKEAKKNLDNLINETRKEFDSNTALAAEVKKLQGQNKESKRAEAKKEISKLIFRGNYIDNVKGTTKNVTMEDYQEYVRSSMETLTEAEERVVRSVIGNDADNASQIIPVFTDKNMIGETAYQLPELDGAVSISIEGEATTKVPINIAPVAAPTRKVAGEASDEVTTNAVTAELTPQIYSQHFPWNPRMQSHASTVAQDTLNLMNAHRKGWRKEFATTLLTHIGVTFASLKGSDKNKSTYTGGATLDAVHISSTASTITLKDLDALIDPLVAKYGKQGVTESFRFYMNSKTWGFVKDLARQSNNDSTIRVDLDNMKIDGIRVITNDDFAEDIADGKHPVVLYNAQDVRVYGGQTIIRDSSEKEWTKRLQSRQVTTLGEVKLFDPHYRTRVLKIKPTTAK